MAQEAGVSGGEARGVKARRDHLVAHVIGHFYEKG